MNKLKDDLNKARHRYYDFAKILMFVIAIMLVFWQMPRTGKFKYSYERAKPWQHESLYAPFDFPIYKSDDMVEAENKAARDSVKPFFHYDGETTAAARDALDKTFNAQWRTGGADKALNERYLLRCFDTIERKGIVAYDKAFDDLDADSEINLIVDKTYRVVPFGTLYTMNSATDSIAKWLGQDSRINAQFLTTLLLGSLRQNVFFDEQLTQQEVDKALSDVSLTYGMVQKDELIISEGEIVNEHDYAVLSSLQREVEGRSLSTKESYVMLIGQFLLVALVFILMAVYLRLFHQKTVYSELRKINMLLLVMLLMIIPSYWIMKMHPSYILVMPVTIMVFMLITFYDSTIAFVTEFFTVLLIAVVVPNSFMYVFLQLTASMVAIYSLKNHDNRINYFRTSFLVFLSYFLVYSAFSMLSSSEVSWQVVGLLGLNALFTLLSLPLIGLFERVFGFTTSLTLLELSNTNRPLLRKLATTAPGTFQHSIQVANLCEEVLYAIGGDGLLARTGALYHDIGKMQNPMYFTENQRGGYNSHDDITNVESAEIIISHVLNGVVMAQKAHLPEQIVDFIRTHHGTRRTEYFYRMEQRAHPDTEIDVREFTYHGPIPFSRETAVLMISDSVEAASRSLKEPSEKNISELVDNIIDKQMADGQFMNVDLTMRDFSTIRKVLKKNLMSIYHVRVAYPN